MKKIRQAICLLIFLISHYGFSQTQIGDDLLGEGFQHFYGYSTATNSDGSIVGVGAVGFEGNGFQSGYVQIYSLDNGNWIQLGSDLLGEAADDRFGTSISFNSSGTRIAIGAPYHRVDGTNVAGHVKVFDYDGSNWVQVGGDIDPPVNFSAFGTSVKLNPTGEYLIVGAENHSEGNGSVVIGSTRVYRLNNGTWEQIGSDIDGDNQNDHSGFSVDINNDASIIAISYYRSDGDTGKVKMFELNSSNEWIQKGNTLVGGGPNYSFGYSINMNAAGDRIVIGEIRHGGAPARGIVLVYDYISSTDTWTQVGQTIFGDDMNDAFGYSVDISADGSVVVIGAPQNGNNGFWNGEVNVFKLLGNTWTQIGVDINGEGSQAFMGNSVSISEDAEVMVVASNSSNAPGFSSAGIVEVFSLTDILSNESEALEEVKVFKKENQSIHVGIQEAGDYDLELYDITGKIIMQTRAYIDDYKEFDISGNSHGIYIFKLVSVKTGQSFQKKIMI